MSNVCLPVPPPQLRCFWSIGEENLWLVEEASHCTVIKQSTKSALGSLVSCCGNIFIFKNQKLHFWLKWHTLYPLNAFSFCNWEENMVGKIILLDIMEHVYLRGYHFSGSATHRSSMLMDIEMWSKHFFLLCSTAFHSALFQIYYKSIGRRFLGHPSVPSFWERHCQPWPPGRSGMAHTSYYWIPSLS